ncbi:MAG: hypothetical protein AB8B56_04150 [Crocinitomicaceae bacterium]
MNHFYVLLFLVNSMFGFSQEELLKSAIEDITEGEITIKAGDTTKGKVWILSGLSTIEEILNKDDFSQVDKWKILGIKGDNFKKLVKYSTEEDSLWSIVWANMARKTFDQLEKDHRNEIVLIHLNNSRRRLKDASINQGMRLKSALNFVRSNQMYALAYDLSKQLNEVSADELFALGNSYEQLGDSEKSQHYYQECLQVDSTNFDVNARLGTQRFDDAQLIYRIWKMNQPNSPGHGEQQELPEGVSSEKYQSLLVESEMYLERLYDSNQANVEIMETLLKVYDGLGKSAEFSALKLELDTIKNEK